MIGLLKHGFRIWLRGIQVNVIAPGFIATDMTDKIPEGIKEEIIKKIPL